MNDSQKSNQIRAACVSDVGCARQKNQDSYLVSLEQNLFIISDGLGGHQAGDIASKAVVTILPKLIERRLAGVTSRRNRIVELALRESIVELSQRLRAESADHAGLQGMGATVALVWVQSSTGLAHLAHMGDSRIYLFRQNSLSQLTEDHSVVALLLKHGEIGLEEAKEHPARSRLSRYVGMEGDVYPDVNTISLHDGDRLLLCSDGLTGMVPDDEIMQLLRANVEPEAACHALVEAANIAGGKDNITALVVDWDQVRSG